MKLEKVFLKYHYIFCTDYTQDADCWGAWLFKEGAGVSVDDASPNEHDGSFRGAGEPAWDSDTPGAASWINYSVLFDNTDDYISFLSSPAGSISCVAWVKPNNVGVNYNQIIAREPNLWHSFLLQYKKLGHRWYYSGYKGFLTLNDVVEVDTWYHVASSVDGSSFNVRLYVNGVEKRDATGVNAPPSGVRWIGASWASGQTFYGRITEAGVFKRVLDATEINEIMDEGLTGEGGVNPYPTYLLNKKAVTGYHCFLGAYMDAKRKEYDPLKLPDGTTF